MGTCRNLMWAVFSEKNKMLKTLESLWFELTLKRKPCSLEGGENGEGVVYLRLASPEYTWMKVMQGSDSGNSQELWLWKKVSNDTTVRSETEKCGQLSTGVFKKQITDTVSAFSASYRSSTGFHCFAGAGETSSLKLTQACPEEPNLWHKLILALKVVTKLWG